MTSKQPWDSRFRKWERGFDRRPDSDPKLTFWRVLGISLAVVIVVWSLGFIDKWWDYTPKVMSAERSATQYALIVKNWNGLYVEAEGACSSFKEGDMVTTEIHVVIYRRIVVEYNNRMIVIYEAGLVGPAGYPKEIPKEIGMTGDWCSVPVALDALRGEQ
jgi:hypothetical protein